MSLTSTLRDINRAIEKGELDHDAATAVLAAWGERNLTGGLDPEEASKLLTDDRKQ